MDRGTRVDERFVIEAQIAVGGMGTVHRALDRTSERTVAVKVLRDVADDARMRLEREARALSELSHPNVVRYVAHGRLADGAPYLVMDWIEGETLSARLKRAPVSTSEAIRLVRAIADALAYVHQRGLVHRDVKPGNVVLRAGALDAPTLVDFGLVRMAADVSVTGTGTIVGTPSFMSPEQARGERDVGPATDVFSLGCVLFRCITGRNAFVASDGLAVLAKVLLDDPPRARELVPDLDPRVDDAIDRLLTRDAERRPRDGSAVVRLLDELGSVADAAPALSSRRGFGHEERKLRTVVIAETKFDRDATLPRSSALLLTIEQRLARFGARSDIMASGALVVTMTGADSAKEHARHAAACALDLAALVPVPIAVATGHTTASDQGEVRDGGRDSDVFDRAARLLRRARGEDARHAIRIDETTAALIGESFVVEATADGLELRGAASDGAVRTLLGKSTPFVGRERELVTLEAIVDECSREVSARAALVTGAPGIGKSRLKRELLRRLEGRVVVLQGAAEALTRGAPFAVLGRALTSFVGIDPRDDASAAFAKLHARVAEVVAASEADRIAEFLALPCAIDLAAPSSRRAAASRDPILLHDRVRRAFCDLLGALAERGPVVLVLDDLQWVDALTPRLVDAALSALAEKPLFVLGLARSDSTDVVPAFGATRAVIPLPLDGLSRRAALAFARAIIPELSDAAAERVVARAAGNAHYLEELLRAELAGLGDAAPETVLAMVQSRIGALDGASRRLLRGASILGVSFSGAALHALFVDDAEAATAATIDHLVHRDFLVRTASGFAFRDELVGEVAYGMLTEPDARLGHRLAAEHLAQDRNADPVALAEHFARSDEPTRAIAPLLRSAQRALDASDFARALALAARARAAGSSDGRAELVEAEAHRWLGETARSFAAATIAVARIATGDPQRLDALRTLAYGASYLGRTAELDRVVDELEDAPLDEALLPSWLVAASQAATSSIIVGAAARGNHLLERASALYARGTYDAAVTARLLEARVASAAHAGDLELLLRTTTDACANARAAGNDRAAILQTINRGFALLQLAEYEDALAAFVQARTESEWLDLVTHRRSAMQNAGYALLRLDRIDEARALELEVLAEIGGEASPRLVTLTRACLATIEVRAGDLAAAERHARSAVVAATGLPQAAYAETALAEVLLDAEDPAGALAAVDDALAAMERAGGHHFAEATARLVRALALRDLGRVDEARRTIADAALKIEARARTLDEPRRERFRTRVEEHRRTIELAGGALAEAR